MEGQAAGGAAPPSMSNNNNTAAAANRSASATDMSQVQPAQNQHVTSNPSDAENSSSSSVVNPWNVSPAVTASQSELSSADTATSYATATSKEANSAAQNHRTTNDITASSSMAYNLTSNSCSSKEKLEANDAGQQAVASDQNQPHQPLIDFPGAQAAEGAAATTATPATSIIAPAQQAHQQAAQTATATQSHLTVDKSDAADGYHAMQDATANNTATATSSIDAEQETEGGRLWQAALAESMSVSPNKQSTKKSRFAESIMERTRSRADPNALVVSPTNAATNGNTTTGVPTTAMPNTPGGGLSTATGRQSMITLGGADTDTTFILNTALAKKRVRVVQLLLIGLVGLLLGLLGNFFVSTSCHFATVHMNVGQNADEPFEFHFGLWKYSPIDSVFQGYSYCYKYDQNYESDAPVVARVFNIIALVAGLISISILWLYLIFGYADKRRWKLAVCMAVFAGLVQLSTLYFFVGRLCRQQEHACEFGPGAYLSIFTSIVWFVLACEMHYHMPVASYATGYLDHQYSHRNTSSGGAAGTGSIAGTPRNYAGMDEPGSLVTTVEMTNIDEVTREYFTRVTGKTKEDQMPRLNSDLKRVRPKSGLYNNTPTSANGDGFYIASPRGAYQAPPDPSFLEGV